MIVVICSGESPLLIGEWLHNNVGAQRAVTQGDQPVSPTSHNRDRADVGTGRDLSNPIPFRCRRNHRFNLCNTIICGSDDIAVKFMPYTGQARGPAPTSDAMRWCQWRGGASLRARYTVPLQCKRLNAPLYKALCHIRMIIFRSWISSYLLDVPCCQQPAEA